MVKHGEKGLENAGGTRWNLSEKSIQKASLCLSPEVEPEKNAGGTWKSAKSALVLSNFSGQDGEPEPLETKDDPAIAPECA